MRVDLCPSPPFVPLHLPTTDDVSAIRSPSSASNGSLCGKIVRFDLCPSASLLAGADSRIAGQGVCERCRLKGHYCFGPPSSGVPFALAHLLNPGNRYKTSMGKSISLGPRAEIHKVDTLIWRKCLRRRHNCLHFPLSPTPPC